MTTRCARGAFGGDDSVITCSRATVFSAVFGTVFSVVFRVATGRLRKNRWETDEHR
ncbi:MAG: hypothetical protein LBG58_02460 [Planctomycetaceae bacterium]|nr:hypothetical protein [Planctomycetaceae bacterium]